MITLYDDVFSPYARKVRITLYEKGVPFERSFRSQPPDPPSNPTKRGPCLARGAPYLNADDGDAGRGRADDRVAAAHVGGDARAAR